MMRRTNINSNLTTTTSSTNIQWYRKGGQDPWAPTDVNEWEPYSDDQNRVIEKAYQNNAENVNLKKPDYVIDLKRLIQISIRDNIKQRPVKRVNSKDQSNPTNMCVREERFLCCPPPIKKSLNRIDWITPQMISLYEHQYRRPYHRWLPQWIANRLSSFSCIPLPVRCFESSLLLASAGIIEEGSKLGFKAEAETIATNLLDVDRENFDGIKQCIFNLYTKECFLYKAINKFLREEDVMKLMTLGPYCYLLYECIRLSPTKNIEQVLYRGTNLDDKQIETYQSAVGNYGSWHSFISTTRDLQSAVIRGNTLFIIKTKSKKSYSNQLASHSVDISSYSHFPEENETLFRPGVVFKIKRVDQCCDGTHLILLEI